MMTWKKATLENAYEHGRENTFNGNGHEANWKLERQDLTYEDYWIFVCLIGHANYRKYRNSHWDDYKIFAEKGKKKPKLTIVRNDYKELANNETKED